MRKKNIWINRWKMWKSLMGKSFSLILEEDIKNVNPICKQMYLLRIREKKISRQFIVQFLWMKKRKTYLFLKKNFFIFLQTKLYRFYNSPTFFANIFPIFNADSNIYSIKWNIYWYCIMIFFSSSLFTIMRIFDCSTNC